MHVTISLSKLPKGILGTLCSHMEFHSHLVYIRSSEMNYFTKEWNLHSSFKTLEIRNWVSFTSTTKKGFPYRLPIAKQSQHHLNKMLHASCENSNQTEFPQLSIRRINFQTLPIHINCSWRKILPPDHLQEYRSEHYLNHFNKMSAIWWKNHSINAQQLFLHHIPRVSISIPFWQNPHKEISHDHATRNIKRNADKCLENKK